MTIPNLSDLHATAIEIIKAPKIILAADESTGTIGDRLSSVGLDNTLENRRAFRRLIFSAPVANYIGGAILYKETLGDAELVGLLTAQGIIPGIKIDEGLADFGVRGEKLVKGFANPYLTNRLLEYFSQGARFTKFRSLFSITDDDDQLPTIECIVYNAFAQAQFALASQQAGLVPIVEPELDFKGTHEIRFCEDATADVLNAVFKQLRASGVDLKGMILKPSMVTSGKDAKNCASSDEVAKRTVRILLECVPKEVPGIAFLSGGQGDSDADQNLTAIAKLAKQQNAPWRISASFGRGLQRAPLAVWAGKEENVAAAQAAFILRCRQTSTASIS